MAPAMTSGREGNEDVDFISPDDDTIDVTACTRVAYAIARERSPFLQAGPSGSQPQPTITPRRGRSPVRNPYNASVAAPSPSHPSLRQSMILESLVTVNVRQIVTKITAAAVRGIASRATAAAHAVVDKLWGAHHLPSPLRQGNAHTHPWCESL
jgi:hypothetical protein